jgi:hypothetical protein
MALSERCEDVWLTQGSNMQQNTQIGRDRAGSVFRLYLGGSAIITWFLAVTEPRSMVSVAASSSAGTALIWLLLVIGCMAILDAVINDFLPEKCHWRSAVRQRHFILSAMAFCYVAQLYVAFYGIHSIGLLLYYLWNAATIMFIAFVDAHQRSKDATCVVICTS